MKTWHDNLKETVTGEAEGETDTETANETRGVGNIATADVDSAGAVELPERQSNNPLMHEAGDDGGAPTDAQFGDAPGDGDALERLSAQMQDQQRQISMLLNQQAQVMEAIAKLTDVKATKQEKETGRMTVS